MLLNAGIIGASAGGATTLLDGLLAWYSMGEASGNALDAHSGGYTLTQSGTVGSTTGKVGNARSFDGIASNYLSSSDAVFDVGDSDLHIAFWIYPVNLSNNPGALGRYTFTTANRSFMLQFNASRPSLVASGNGTASSTALHASTISLSNWNFIEAYHDATNNLIGVAINGGAFTTAAHSTGLFGGDASFAVGRVDLPGANGLPLNGRMDEIAIWNRILTAGERTEIYNSGAGIGYPG